MWILINENEIVNLTDKVFFIAARAGSELFQSQVTCAMWSVGKRFVSPKTKVAFSHEPLLFNAVSPPSDITAVTRAREKPTVRCYLRYKTKRICICICTRDNSSDLDSVTFPPLWTEKYRFPSLLRIENQTFSEHATSKCIASNIFMNAVLASKSLKFSKDFSKKIHWI